MKPWGGRFKTLIGPFALPVVLPAGARCEPDLAYGADPAQRLDVYTMPGGARRTLAPLIVLVHGGGWAIGDKAGPRVVANKLGHWLPKGYAVVSVNYRLLPSAGPLEQAADLARALAFVQREAHAWGADGKRLALIGHSTGAHLAALVAADADLAAAHGVAPWLATVLLDTAALDVEQTLLGPHLPLHERAFGDDPTYWRSASPLHQLQRSSRAPSPMLLAHAAARPDSAVQSARFAEAVQQLGGRAEVLSVRLSHADINAELGRDPAYTAAVDAFLGSLNLPGAST